jgi:hypothetical protein
LMRGPTQSEGQHRFCGSNEIEGAARPPACAAVASTIAWTLTRAKRYARRNPVNEILGSGVEDRREGHRSSAAESCVDRIAASFWRT